MRIELRRQKPILPIGLQILVVLAAIAVTYSLAAGA